MKNLFALCLFLFAFCASAQTQVVVKLADQRACGSVSPCWVELSYFIPTAVGYGTHKKIAVNADAYRAEWGPNVIAPQFTVEETEAARQLPLLLEALNAPYGAGDPRFRSEFDSNNDGVINYSDIPLIREQWKQYGGNVIKLTYGGAGKGTQFPLEACVRIGMLSGYFDPEVHLFQRVAGSTSVSNWYGPGVVVTSQMNCPGGVIDVP